MEVLLFTRWKTTMINTWKLDFLAISWSSAWNHSTPGWVSGQTSIVPIPVKDLQTVFIITLKPREMNDRTFWNSKILFVLDKWSPALQIRTVLLSIQALLSAPNPDDPLANDVAEQWKTNEAKAIETGRTNMISNYCTSFLELNVFFVQVLFWVSYLISARQWTQMYAVHNASWC